MYLIPFFLSLSLSLSLSLPLPLSPSPSPALSHSLFIYIYIYIPFLCVCFLLFTFFYLSLFTFGPSICLYILYFCMPLFEFCSSVSPSACPSSHLVANPLSFYSSVCACISLCSSLFNLTFSPSLTLNVICVCVRVSHSLSLTHSHQRFICLFRYSPLSS
jgi:hypothetical protein